MQFDRNALQGVRRHPSQQTVFAPRIRCRRGQQSFPIAFKQRSDSMARHVSEASSFLYSSVDWSQLTDDELRLVRAPV